MWQVLSLVFVAIFVLSVVIQLRTWRRQRRVRPVFIAVSQIAALAASIGFSVLTDRPPEADVWVALLAVGIAGGVIYGGMMHIDRNERGVVMSYSFPAIITWTALMTITQLSAILSKSVPVIIFSIAIANLGVNLGMNGRVLYGYSRIRVGPAVGLLAVVALAVAPMLPAAAQEAEDYVPGNYDVESWQVDWPDWEACSTVPGDPDALSCWGIFEGPRAGQPSLHVTVDRGSAHGWYQFHTWTEHLGERLDGWADYWCEAPISADGQWQCAAPITFTAEGAYSQTSSYVLSFDLSFGPGGAVSGGYAGPVGGQVAGVLDHAFDEDFSASSDQTDPSSTALDYSGVYLLDLGSAELPGGDVLDQDFTLEVAAGGSVRGYLSASASVVDPVFRINDQIISVELDITVSTECVGLISSAGAIDCSGTASITQSGVVPLSGEPVSLSDSGPVTLTGTIYPDGTFVGVMTDPGGYPQDVSGYAISGGPTPLGVTDNPALDAEAPDAGTGLPSTSGDTSATPGLVPTPLPGDIGGGETGEFPFEGTENPPLEPEDAAAATALSAFLLAGGSMAQLLPLMEGGVSLADALRALQGSTAPSGTTAGSLAGLPTLEDGRVMYQPPWEEGGPVPMDPDWVLEVMDMERRGFRWMGESKGWMNDAQVAQNERWEAADTAAVAQAKEEFIAGHRAREAELERRREALRFVGHAAEAALKRDDDVMQMAYDQIQAQAYNEDGSLNLEYVGELRSFMRNRLLRDIDYPEESLHQGWVGDFASNTFDEARHSAAIRILAGIGTGGQSEWLYQAQAVVDAVGEASKNSDQPLTIADGLRAGYWAAADENLPVTTLAKVYNGEEVTVFDVLGDVMKGRATQQYVKHEYFGDAHGLLRSQRRALQATATRHNVDYTPMNVTSRPGFRAPGELAEGKPMFMKQKSINSDDVRYLDYSPSDIGRVPGQPRPPKPSKFTDAAEYRAAKAHYRQRVAEWQSAGGATRTKMASGEVVEVDGLLYTVKDGKPHAPYVSDIEPADVFDHSTGRRLTDDRIVRVQDDMAQRGLPVGDHGSPYSFDPRVTLKDDFPADVLERIERVEIPGTGGAKPTVSWRLDGEELTGEVAERLKKADDLRTRLIDKVEAGDVGEEFIAGGSAGTRRWADYGEGFEHIQGASGTAVQDLGERGYW